MNWIKYFGVIEFLFCFFPFAYATLKLKQIIGPDYVKIGTTNELILDCDFDATGEDDVVVKWFFNGLQDQIYQWIAPDVRAYALGPLKELIDPTYRISDNPNSMLRALRFKEVSTSLSGNYTCKVDTAEKVKWLTKQVIVYSPAESFQVFITGENNIFQGDEAVYCQASNVSPKPDFDLYIAGTNGSSDLPKMFTQDKKDTFDGEFYNMSRTISFNTSYLEESSTKFVCQLSIPGTDYTETKTVELPVESNTEPSSSELDYGEYGILNCTSTYMEETLTDNRDNGTSHLHSSFLFVLLLMFSLVWAT